MKYTLLKALVFAALLVWVYPVDCDTEAAKVCTECSATDKCAENKCKEGYYYLATETYGCKKCALENCKTCTATECTVCVDGYTINDNKDSCNKNFGSYLFCGLGILLSLLIFI